MEHWDPKAWVARTLAWENVIARLSRTSDRASSASPVVEGISRIPKSTRPAPAAGLTRPNTAA